MDPLPVATLVRRGPFGSTASLQLGEGFTILTATAIIKLFVDASRQLALLTGQTVLEGRRERGRVRRICRIPLLVALNRYGGAGGVISRLTAIEGITFIRAICPSSARNGPTLAISGADSVSRIGLGLV